PTDRCTPRSFVPADSLVPRDPAPQPRWLAGEDRDRNAFPHAAGGSFRGEALAGLFVRIGDVLGDGLSLDEPAALEVGGVVVPVDAPLLPEQLLQLVACLAVELFLAEAGLGGHLDAVAAGVLLAPGDVVIDFG